MDAVTYAEDFYADDFILNPIPRYADMRQRGPVCGYRIKTLMTTRHAEVVEVLNRTKTFLSGKGISISDDVNKILVGSTINSMPGASPPPQGYRNATDAEHSAS